MRIFTVSVIALSLVGAPAFAQTPCSIVNTADGISSKVRGDIADTTLSMLVTDNGPFPAKLTFDAGAAYKLAPGGQPTLNVIRVGNSVVGKDWLQPGSVETVDGGLLMKWPGFTLNGKRLRNLSVELASGYTKSRRAITYPASHKGPDALFLRLDGRLAAPPGSELVETNYAELGQWRSAVIRRAEFRVDVFDEDKGTHVASIDFTIPADNVTQARLISDVNALRRASAEKTCKP